MSYQSIRYGVSAGVATITMACPENLNALTVELVGDLSDALTAARQDAAVRAVVLTGGERTFCAGGNVKGMLTLGTVEGLRYMTDGLSWVRELASLPKPVVAAVNGFALGAGLSMALACDAVIAAEDAKFGCAFSRVGLVPDAGLLFYLPRIVGLHVAKDLVFSGRTLTAAEALRLGIVRHVVPADQLLSEAGLLAAEWAAGPPVAISLAKSILNASHALTLDQVLTQEGQAQAIMFQTLDHQEGVAAFRERRAPRFQGR